DHRLPPSSPNSRPALRSISPTSLPCRSPSPAVIAFAAFLGEALVPARGWLESTYQSEITRALWAPWVLHAGLGPEDAFSGQIAKVIAFALEAAGAPIVKGGTGNLLSAFEALIKERGGVIRTEGDVASVIQTNGRATGVRLTSGETVNAKKSVICSVTPTQLYERLLGDAAPKADLEAAQKYRYGKGNFQIHYALDKPPAWRGEGLDKVALLHLTPGLDGVSKACNEATRGMLPEVPTICVGQPHALDPSRCPEGKAILWLQLPEAPRTINGDAAGKLPPPADGRWTEALREAYADRAEAILASHIDGFKDSVIARRAYSPVDLEAMNVNLVGGDPYGGSSTIDQSFLWRPFKTSRNHATGVKGLYHIGASTHPGAGLGGGSGFLLAGRL
ncbi:MAG: NAD(P)/FAD-dependent oxidoreductase, partial [Mesorhizobium sp.]